MGYRTFSPYFGPPRPTPATVRMVAVPPADTTAFLFFYVSNKDENIRLLRYRTGKRVQLVTNAKSLRSYYAKRRKKRAPVTYEMRWEIACAQRWKCKACKKLLPLAAQVDHTIPLSAGGKDDMSNMQMLCANCHAEKSRTEAKRGVGTDRGILAYATTRA